jgi:hypothetical protein
VHPALPIPPASSTGSGALRRAASTPAPQAAPVIVCRRVSQPGSIMVAIQRIHVGVIHARKIVTVAATDHSFWISLDSETISVVLRGEAPAVSTITWSWKSHVAEGPQRSPEDIADCRPGWRSLACIRVLAGPLQCFLQRQWLCQLLT